MCDITAGVGSAAAGVDAIASATAHISKNLTFNINNH